MLKLPPEEINLDQLVNFAISSLSIKRLSGLDPLLVEVYENYAKNLNRVWHLAKFLVLVTISSLETGALFVQSVYDETGSVKPKKISPHQLENIRLRMQRIDYGLASPSQKTLRKKLTGQFKLVLNQLGRESARGQAPVAHALIILAWTAFEVLSEDLLERVVKMRPKSVAASKRSYRSLRAIQKTYRNTLGAKYPAINRAVFHRSLDTLSATRNLLVHKGGKVDAEFISRVAGIAAFSGLVEGSYLQLDFGLVRKIIVPTGHRGLNLIRAVNRWTKDHAP